MFCCRLLYGSVQDAFMLTCLENALTSLCPDARVSRFWGTYSGSQAVMFLKCWKYLPYVKLTEMAEQRIVESNEREHNWHQTGLYRRINRTFLWTENCRESWISQSASTPPKKTNLLCWGDFYFADKPSIALSLKGAFNSFRGLDQFHLTIKNLPTHCDTFVVKMQPLKHIWDQSVFDICCYWTVITEQMHPALISVIGQYRLWLNLNYR